MHGKYVVRYRITVYSLCKQVHIVDGDGGGNIGWEVSMTPRLVMSRVKMITHQDLVTESIPTDRQRAIIDLWIVFI
jgi:hypothetical protein